MSTVPVQDTPSEQQQLADALAVDLGKTPMTIPDDDPDMIELRAAQAALAALENPPAPAMEEPVSPAAPVAEEPIQVATPPAPTAEHPAKGVTIPKGRLDQALEQREQALREAAYWKGVAEARATQTPTVATTPVPSVKTPEERLAEIDAKRLDLAGQFDDGALTARQWKEQETALDREARALISNTAKPAPVHQGSEDLYLDELTAGLEAKHPYAKEIPIDDPAWPFIRQRAALNLQAQGVRLIVKPDGFYDARSEFAVRKAMAEMTDTLGPALTGKTLTVPGAQPPAAPAAPTPPAGPSAAAQARAQKLALAASLPPDVSTLGHAEGGIASVTAADITRMSDDEIMALPAAVRAKFLNSA